MGKHIVSIIKIYDILQVLLKFYQIKNNLRNSTTYSLVQWEIVLLMQYCDRVDQSMKLSTVFVEGMYSNIRRGAIQI